MPHFLVYLIAMLLVVVLGFFFKLHDSESVRTTGLALPSAAMWQVPELMPDVEKPGVPRFRADEIYRESGSFSTEKSIFFYRTTGGPSMELEVEMDQDTKLTYGIRGYLGILPNALVILIAMIVAARHLRQFHGLQDKAKVLRESIKQRSDKRN